MGYFVKYICILIVGKGTAVQRATVVLSSLTRVRCLIRGFLKIVHGVLQ